jgi:hypothetical protein
VLIDPAHPGLQVQGVLLGWWMNGRLWKLGFLIRIEGGEELARLQFLHASGVRDGCEEGARGGRLLDGGA